MAGIDREISCERATQSLVGGDERFQALVDLAVRALALLLHGVHEDQADSDGNERNQREAQQRGERALPGIEVDDVAHETDGAAHLSVPRRPAES
jgi:hypothetical protein